MNIAVVAAAAAVVHYVVLVVVDGGSYPRERQNIKGGVRGLPSGRRRNYSRTTTKMTGSGTTREWRRGGKAQKNQQGVGWGRGHREGAGARVGSGEGRRGQ